MKYWEIIADKLSAAGWSWGYCSAVTKDGWRWIVDAHKNDGKRYIVQSLAARPAVRPTARHSYTRHAIASRAALDA